MRIFFFFFFLSYFFRHVKSIFSLTCEKVEFFLNCKSVATRLAFILLTLCLPGNFHAFLSSADIIQNKLYRKILSGIPLVVLECGPRSGPTFCRA